MNIVIIGYGEIGKSIEELYNIDSEDGYYISAIDIEGTVEDTIRFSERDEIEVMHICIPFVNNFVEIVKEHYEKYKPKLVIIESTIPIGTTRKLTDIPVVHSPIMGKHPILVKGLKTFTKMVGGVDNKVVEDVCNHFYKLGVDTIIFDSPDETEAAKLLSTTYYGWNILYMQQVYDLCKENKLNFDNVYTKLNKLYNNGYKKLGEEQVVRPVLKYMGKKINGHCIVPNFHLLKKDFKPAKIALEILNAHT